VALSGLRVQDRLLRLVRPAAWEVRVSTSVLEVRRDGPVVSVTLTRPHVRNAIDEHLVAALTAWARETRGAEGVRVAVLAGAGPVFCAGADAGWMARMAAFSHEENVRDAGAFAEMLEALDSLPMPLIGRIQGAALGGGAGLAAVCDVVAAADDAVFGFTEVKLGIPPGAISPYVVAKIGVSAARALFLTGARFGAGRAREIGLVHEVVPADELDETVNRLVREILTAGPQAVSAAKRLVGQVAGRAPRDVRGLTVEAMAHHRASPEGQEGLRAFLEKRRPAWAANEPERR